MYHLNVLFTQMCLFLNNESEARTAILYAPTTKTQLTSLILETTANISTSFILPNYDSLRIIAF
jgi:hypothetical protein